MKRVLAWKVTATFLVFLIPIIITTIVIALNLIATQQTIAYVNEVALRETQIYSSFDANYQRLLAEVGMFSLYGEEDEADEAAVLIDNLQQTLAEAERVHTLLHNSPATALAGLINEEAHEELEARRAAQLEQLVAIAQDVFTRESQLSAAELDELIETLEDLEAANTTTQSDAATLAQTEGNAVIRTLNNQLRLVILTFAIMLLLLLALMGLALWLAQRTIIKPVNQLATAAQAVTDGQLERHVPITSNDELGILQRSFNAMVDSLRVQHATLEQQNTSLVEEQVALARAMQELEHGAQERTALQQQMIHAQQVALRELSSPLIPIADKVVVMPLIGAIDTHRAEQILESLLAGVEQHRAVVAIIDITGVQMVDTSVAQVLLQAAQAINLLGAQVMLTGVRPQIAQTFVHLGIDLSSIRTFSTLQQGIAAAIVDQPRTESLRRNAPKPPNGTAGGNWRGITDFGGGAA